MKWSLAQNITSSTKKHAHSNLWCFHLVNTYKHTHTHSVPSSSEFLTYAYSHYSDVTMVKTASQITSLTIVYSTVYSGVDQRKYQSSAPLAFVGGIHRLPVNSPHKHKGPVTQEMFPFDDVIMQTISGDGFLPGSYALHCKHVILLTKIVLPRILTYWGPVSLHSRLGLSLFWLR